jgi:hypothetical protein
MVSTRTAVFRVCLHDAARCLHPVHARHAKVHDNDIGPAEADLAYGLLAGSSLSHDLDAIERGEQGRKPTP